jgi:hypothetical protein
MGLYNVLHAVVDSIDVPHEILVRLFDELLVVLSAGIDLALAAFGGEIGGGRVGKVGLICFGGRLIDKLHVDAWPRTRPLHPPSIKL